MNVLGVGISSTTIIAVVVGIALLALIFGAGVFLKRRPHHLNQKYFQTRWLEAQGLCSNKDTWPLAIINADKLLDEALKRSKYKGKTMGERLVSAQHHITSNDDVWFGHKLRNRLVHEEFTKLKKKDVIQALLGFRSALKDLGALK